eukprot:c12139_g1_i1.p1 GENE.c12139_g1_i1~~c12139_g1_i1.p1  ORF type:complete len:185 (+),score=38.13 c12139_g1_i1:803-1357(+)
MPSRTRITRNSVLRMIQKIQIEQFVCGCLTAGLLVVRVAKVVEQALDCANTVPRSDSKVSLFGKFVSLLQVEKIKFLGGPFVVKVKETSGPEVLVPNRLNNPTVEPVSVAPHVNRVGRTGVADGVGGEVLEGDLDGVNDDELDLDLEFVRDFVRDAVPVGLEVKVRDAEREWVREWVVDLLAES